VVGNFRWLKAWKSSRLTDDFVSPDDLMANALTTVALAGGCSVLFDEQAGG